MECYKNVVGVLKVLRSVVGYRFTNHLMCAAGKMAFGAF